MNEIRRIKRENSEIRSQLKSDYYLAIDKMYRYLNMSALNAYDVEVLKKDLMGMLLEGQQRGETVEEVIGADQEVFLKMLMKNCRQRTWLEFLLYGFSLVGVGAAIMFAAQWLLLSGGSMVVAVTAQMPFMLLVFLIYAGVLEIAIARLIFHGGARIVGTIGAAMLFWGMMNWVDDLPLHSVVLFTTVWWLPVAVSLLLSGAFYYAYVRVTVKKAGTIES